MKIAFAVLLTASVAVSMPALADSLKTSELEEKGAAKLSKGELQSLLPGAKVRSVAPSTGSTRTWENTADGKFYASSDNRGALGGKQGLAQARGEWRLSDDGKYCVEIDWGRSPEKWCRTMYKLGDKYYGAGKDKDAPPWEFEFRK